MKALKIIIKVVGSVVVLAFAVALGAVSAAFVWNVATAIKTDLGMYITYGYFILVFAVVFMFMLWTPTAPPPAEKGR